MDGIWKYSLEPLAQIEIQPNMTHEKHPLYVIWSSLLMQRLNKEVGVHFLNV